MKNEKYDLARWMRKPLWPVDAACRLVCGADPFKYDEAAKVALRETDDTKQLPWVRLFADADGAITKRELTFHEKGESRGVDPAEFLEWVKDYGYDKEYGCDVAHLIAALPAAKVKAVPVISPSGEQWKENARTIGVKIYKKTPRLNMDKIAEKTHAEMTAQKDKGESGMTGRGGKVPSADTIKRHALTGIKT